jgi:hypothetical protein
MPTQTKANKVQKCN